MPKHFYINSPNLRRLFGVAVLVMLMGSQFLMGEEPKIKLKDKIWLGSPESAIFDQFIGGSVPNDPVRLQNSNNPGLLYIEAMGSGEITAFEELFPEKRDFGEGPDIAYRFFVHEKVVYKIMITRKYNGKHDYYLRDANSATVARIRELFGTGARIDDDGENIHVTAASINEVVDYSYNGILSELTITNLARESAAEIARIKFESSKNKILAGF